MSFQYNIQIKEHHLDSYQHVNNATYLALYEEARWELITGRGYGYEKVHATGLGPVILEINLKFFKEIKIRERINITVDVLSYQSKIFKLKQEMLKENGESASELIITGAFFDLNKRKILSPNNEWLAALGLHTY